MICVLPVCILQWCNLRNRLDVIRDTLHLSLMNGFADALCTRYTKVYLSDLIRRNFSFIDACNYTRDRTTPLKKQRLSLEVLIRIDNGLINFLCPFRKARISLQYRINKKVVWSQSHRYFVRALRCTVNYRVAALPRRNDRK